MYSGTTQMQYQTNEVDLLEKRAQEKLYSSKEATTGLYTQRLFSPTGRFLYLLFAICINTLRKLVWGLGECDMGRGTQWCPSVINSDKSQVWREG
jgi:hypothetical protein